MFSSHPPSSSPHALEHRQLHSPPSPASPLPTGECRFILLHPSIQNQRCSCQGFRLNRSIPGSSCECGHLACYHVPAAANHETCNLVSFTQHIALMEKVRKLEEELAESQRYVEDSQRALEDMQRARADDAIAARETMRFFWRAMEKKLVEMDDKIEATMDMAHESREDVKGAKFKIESVEDSTMALEARLDTVVPIGDDTTNVKRRRGHKSSSSSSSSSKIDNLPAPEHQGTKEVSTSSTSLSPVVNNQSDTSKSPSSPRLTPTTHTRSPSAPPALQPASDFASPAESIKAFAPQMAKAAASLSRGNTASPFEPFDAPSPVDFLASIANMPMKRQIRELDNGTVEALGEKAMGKRRKKVAGAGGGDIGAIKERLVSMPVNELSDGLDSR